MNKITRRPQVNRHMFVFGILAVLAIAFVATGCRKPWYRTYGINSEKDLTQPQSIPKLCKAIRDGNCEAVNSLAAMGPAAKQAMPELIDIVRNAGSCMDELLAVFKTIDPESKELVSALADSLKKDTCQAAEVLAKLGPNAKEAEPVLIWSIKEGGCMMEALKTLRQINPDSKEILPAALKAIERVDAKMVSARGVSHVAGSWLSGEGGSKASLLDKDYVAELAPAIAAFGAQAVPALVLLLGHEKWQIKFCAIRVLAHIGLADDAVKQALEAAKSDKDENVRKAAEDALRRVKFSAIALGADGGQRAKNANIVLAVFDVQDPGKMLKAAEVDQLTDVLSSRMTEVAGYRVMPRNELRSQLAKQKTQSFQQAFDDKSQIELGKAVAAQKSLATKVMGLRQKCAITANLYDLKTETCEKATTLETGCAFDALMEATKTIAERLIK